MMMTQLVSGELYRVSNYSWEEASRCGVQRKCAGVYQGTALFMPEGEAHHHLIPWAYWAYYSEAEVDS